MGVLQPAISVVMPLYNKEREVARAIRSVLAQSVTDYELIVVDDGSTDNGPKVVETLKNSRVRMIRQANSGVSAARNRGIALSQSELIAFLDADDEWAPDYLETMLRLACRFPVCGVYGSGYSYRRVGGYTRPAILRGLPDGFDEGILCDYFLIAVNSDPPLCSSAVVVRKSCIQMIGGFPTGVSAGEDLLTWARLAYSYPVAYSRQPKAFFWDPEDLSARHGRTPAETDAVEEGLVGLLEKATPEQRPALRLYLSLWKRMRGVIYLEKGNRKKALVELNSAIRYGGISDRLRILRTLSLLPCGDRVFKLILFSRDIISKLYTPPVKTSGSLHVTIIWQRFLPYHLARIREMRLCLAELGHSLTAVEVASQDTTYGFDQAIIQDSMGHICCFSGSSYHDHAATEIYDVVKKKLATLKPDVIFAPATPFPEGMSALCYRRDSDARLVMMDDAWEHTDRTGFLTRLIKKLLHRNVDAAFIPAPSHAAYFQSLGFPADRLIYGVDVVDNDYYAIPAAVARSTNQADYNELGLPANYFLYVGRFLPCKGVDVLLAAYAHYRTRVDRPWDLVLVGNGTEEESLRRQAKSIHGIHFSGVRTGEELCRYYGLANVLVVPSESDTWALVVNEGMAAGLPVLVSSGCGCVRSLVDEGENGWSFAPGDVQELTECLVRIAELSDEDLAKMGRRSQEVVADWGLDRFVAGVLQALCVSRRPPAGLLSNLAARLWKGRVRVN